MNGQTLDDLNGDGRFLRGSDTSGTEQSHAFQGHFHNLYDQDTNQVSITSSGGSSPGCVEDAVRYNYPAYVGAPVTDGSHGTPQTDSETRPINMSVKWIIRIK